MAAARTGGALPGRLLDLPADHEPRPLVRGLQPDQGHVDAGSGSATTSDLVHEQRVLAGRQEHGDPHDGAGVAIQVVARHGARALLQPEPARLGDRARDPDPADAADADRGRADVAGAAQPAVGPAQLGRGQARASATSAGSPTPTSRSGRSSSSTRGSGRRSSSSSSTRACRRCRRRSSRRAPSTAPAGSSGLRYLTLPLLMPAIVFAAVFRGIDAFRTFDLVFGLTNGGPVTVDLDALVRGLPERLRVPALRLRVGGLVRDGDRRRDRDHAAASGSFACGAWTWPT